MPSRPNCGRRMLARWPGECIRPGVRRVQRGRERQVLAGGEIADVRLLQAVPRSLPSGRDVREVAAREHVTGCARGRLASVAIRADGLSPAGAAFGIHQLAASALPGPAEAGALATRKCKRDVLRATRARRSRLQRALHGRIEHRRQLRLAPIRPVRQSAGRARSAAPSVPICAPSGSESSSTATTTACIAPLTAPGEDPKQRFRCCRALGPAPQRDAQHDVPGRSAPARKMRDEAPAARSRCRARGRTVDPSPSAATVAQESGDQARGQRQQVERGEQEAARPAGPGAEQDDGQQQQIDGVKGMPAPVWARPADCDVGRRLTLPGIAGAACRLRVSGAQGVRVGGPRCLRPRPRAARSSRSRSPPVAQAGDGHGLRGIEELAEVFGRRRRGSCRRTSRAIVDGGTPPTAGGRATK